METRPAQAEPGADPPGTPSSRVTLGLGLAILAVTLLVYWPSLGFEFLNYDDPEYVTDNPHVTGGLTAENVAWAFSESHAANWHPLTWLSHQLDCTLFGLDPGPPHAVNVGLHLANTALLLALLVALGLSPLAGAWIAALFALHPLHVESVAWVSERKDVLSTLFGLLALGAYVAWGRRGGAGRYALVTLLLTLGLLAKPMLVTLPVLFLLLDLWPLGRLGHRKGRALLEKLPWFALALASSVVTLIAQREAKSSLDLVDVSQRVQTAVVGYGRYLVKMFWPLDSAVLYPHPYMPGGDPYSALQVGASAFLLVAVTGAVALAWRRGWTVLGWGWFVVLLLPVCGLVQVGSAAIADRYTYLSYVGPWILLAQAATLAVRRAPGLAPGLRPGLFGLGLASVAACAWLTHRALPWWQSSETLFRRALDVAPNSPLALVKLGGICDARGDFEPAEAYYRRAIELWPRMPEANLGLATTLNRSRRQAEAIPAYRRAIELDPQSVTAHTNLGLLLTLRGELDEGMALLQRAYELAPGDEIVLRNLGLAYTRSGDTQLAESFLRRSIEIEPDAVSARAYATLARQAGRPADAAEALEMLLALEPDDHEARWSCASAWAMAGERERTRAQVDAGLRAQPSAFNSYRAGSLLIRVGDVDGAIAHFERALEQNPELTTARQALQEARRRKGGG